MKPLHIISTTGHYFTVMVPINKELLNPETQCFDDIEDMYAQVAKENNLSERDEYEGYEYVIKEIDGKLMHCENFHNWNFEITTSVENHINTHIN